MSRSQPNSSLRVVTAAVVISMLAISLGALAAKGGKGGGGAVTVEEAVEAVARNCL